MAHLAFFLMHGRFSMALNRKSLSNKIMLIKSKYIIEGLEF